MRPTPSPFESWKLRGFNDRVLPPRVLRLSGSVLAFELWGGLVCARPGLTGKTKPDHYNEQEQILARFDTLISLVVLRLKCAASSSHLDESAIARLKFAPRFFRPG